MRKEVTWIGRSRRILSPWTRRNTLVLTGFLAWAAFHAVTGYNALIALEPTIKKQCTVEKLHAYLLAFHPAIIGATLFEHESINYSLADQRDKWLQS